MKLADYRFAHCEQHSTNSKLYKILSSIYTHNNTTIDCGKYVLLEATRQPWIYGATPIKIGHGSIVNNHFGYTTYSMGQFYDVKFRCLFENYTKS